MEIPKIQSVPGMPNPVDELKKDIAALKRDMLINPDNREKDQQLIDLDQRELALEEKIRSWIGSDQSDSSVYQKLQIQLMNEEMLREQINGGGKSPLETPAELKNEFLCRMIAMLREKDPHFAPMGTSEGAADVAKLGQIFDQLLADPSLLAQYIKDPSIVESLL